MVKARNALFGYAVLAVVLSLLPPLFPLRLPDLREPLLMLLALVAFTLGLLLSLLPDAPRRVVLGLGWLQMLLTIALGFAVGDILVMFCCWIAVPVLALLAGQLRRGPHRALVAAHAISAAAWVGITCAVVTLTVIGLTTDDLDTAVVVYRLVSQFDITLLPWANFATTLTGLALGLTTRWGLIRYRWVAAKLVISFAILISAFAYVEDSVGAVIEQAEALAATGGSTAELHADGGVVVAGFGLPLLSLVAAMLLSLYKPGGKTRWGRRQDDNRNFRITRITPVAQDTIELELRPVKGSLPPWEPGAHVDLVLPSGLVRQYSIAGERDGAYVVTVLREPDGRGGSAELHRLTPGTRIGLRGPRNKFPLVDAPSYLFVAGGIGITPFLPMTAARENWRLVYRGRSRSSMAYVSELASDDRVSVLPADETARPDLASLLAGVAPGTAVYCCGPASLMTAVAEAMPPHATLYTERFVPTERSAPNEPFEAVLQRSGVVVDVPAGRSLLDAIHEVDPTLDAACEDGVCGSCSVRVLGGVPDHRDDVLQNHERGRTDVLYPCVSRAKGRRIVLDV